MTRTIVCLTALMLASPLTALADGGIASSAINAISTLPEPSTLGILGSGLIGFAVVLRRRLKLA
jgi:F0F1-type ATP synthase membrane subunit c/vacuolar-type H+-ATPase subunit K